MKTLVCAVVSFVLLLDLSGTPPLIFSPYAHTHS